MTRLPDPTATLTGEDRAIYDDILARRRAKGVDHLGPYILCSIILSSHGSSSNSAIITNINRRCRATSISSSC